MAPIEQILEPKSAIKYIISTWINLIIETNTCKKENDRLSQDISNMGLKYGCHTLIDINGINDLISIIINFESWIKIYSIMEINQS